MVIISKYNALTGQAVTTDLNEYVTTETINGVFKMVAEKETGIRNNSALDDFAFGESFWSC